MELVKEINGKTFEDFAIAFMKEYRTYTQDDRLDALMDYIPYIIEHFEDCSSEEEFRMKAKKQDQTLATIQIPHKESGWLLYKPIPITNKTEYKKFYYQTLVFSLVQYIMFFQGADFDIMENGQSIAKFQIAEEQLPHILGLENKYVSNKACSRLEEIIPGYNQLSILDKILALVENQDKIIEWEEQNGGDLFNYFKNMQKNKEFLLLGRFFSESENLPQTYHRVFLLQTRDNQLTLYKKSNMNSEMQRSISKLIIQKGLDNVYFPRSLQAISEQILHTSEFLSIMQNAEGTIEIDGIEALIKSRGLSLEIDVPSFNQRLAKSYFLKVLAAPIVEAESAQDEEIVDSTKPSNFSLLSSLLGVTNIDKSITEQYRQDNSEPISTYQPLVIYDEYDRHMVQRQQLGVNPDSPIEVPDEYEEFDILEEMQKSFESSEIDPETDAIAKKLIELMGNAEEPEKPKVNTKK